MQSGVLGFPSVDQEYAAQRQVIIEELATGSGDYVVPAGVFQLEVYLFGGGAGAGGVSSAAGVYAAGGGGAGEERFFQLTVYPGERIPYSVGALGGGGTAAANGADGTGTIFGPVTANGGRGSKGINVNNASYGTGGEKGGGNPGSDTVPVVFSGYGGSTLYGTGGAAVTGDNNGNSGSGYGAGGSGAISNVSKNGGSGTGGLIRIRYFAPDRQRVPTPAL